MAVGGWVVGVEAGSKGGAAAVAEVVIGVRAAAEVAGIFVMPARQPVMTMIRAMRLRRICVVWRFINVFLQVGCAVLDNRVVPQ